MRPKATLMSPTTKLPVQPAFHAISSGVPTSVPFTGAPKAVGIMMPKRKGKAPTVLIPYGCAVKSRPYCSFMRDAIHDI